MVGGEPFKMRISNEKNSTFVPQSIKLLFDNNQLELIKTLCLLYAFYKESTRKYYKLTDIVFYYCLVNFDLLKLIEEREDKGEISRNLYYRFQQNINQIILELSNLQYVEIKGDVTTKTSDLGIRLTKKGMEFVEGLELHYFSELIEEYSSVINTVDNNMKNRNKIRGGVK